MVLIGGAVFVRNGTLNATFVTFSAAAARYCASIRSPVEVACQLKRTTTT